MRPLSKAGTQLKVNIVRLMELNKYNVKVAALQETKWFGRVMYRVGESTILTAVPQFPPKPGEVLQRDGGVTIVLSGSAVRA